MITSIYLVVFYGVVSKRFMSANTFPDQVLCGFDGGAALRGVRSLCKELRKPT